MGVMIAFLMINSAMYPPPEAAPQPAPSPTEAAPAERAPSEMSALEQVLSDQTPGESFPLEDTQNLGRPVPIDAAPLLPPIPIQTDLIRVLLSNAGGNIISFQLLDHDDGGNPVEMILPGTAGSDAFAIAFGSRDDVISGRVRPETTNFYVRQPLGNNNVVEFYQHYRTASGTEFTLTKRYEFIPGEYIFELRIDLDGRSIPSTRAFDFNGAAYTLLFSPQIGPYFTNLDGRYEFRHYLTYQNERMRTESVNDRNPLVIGNMPTWASISGKYFSLIALFERIPHARNYEITFAAHPEQGLPNSSRLLISHPAQLTSQITDSYLFYIGPKSQEVLNTYERGVNHFNLRDTGFGDIAETRGFLAPLENILKWFLVLFHNMIPNYGIAIILLTLLVKVVMFPLTRKSSESTLRMQTFAPKIKELQEKYKDNKQKLNQEMAELYKKEGYNPIAGCLPMLLQMPIFFAMFNLFNNHFDLRGAMFIPGWITDLSRPEYIVEFDGFALPILGWTALRLLPFIYVGSQLIYGKVTQTPEQRGNNQMKLMLYALPIIFFFILYDMPSGLLVYWIMSNVLTLVQQVLINKYIIKRKPASEGTSQGASPVIAPKKKNKK